MRYKPLAASLLLFVTCGVLAQTFKAVTDRYAARSLVEDFGSEFGIAPQTDARELPLAAVELIKHFEGWESWAYNDPVGYCTIGYGHLIDLKRCEHVPSTKLQKYITNPPKQELSKQQGENILIEDTLTARIALRDLVKVDLTDEQFGALASFVFNIGKSNFSNSTMLQLINENQLDLAAKQFPRWVRAKGQVLSGLVERRGCEQSLYQDQLVLSTEGEFDRKACVTFGAAPESESLIDIEVGE